MFFRYFVFLLSGYILILGLAFSLFGLNKCTDKKSLKKNTTELENKIEKDKDDLKTLRKNKNLFRNTKKSTKEKFLDIERVFGR